MVARVRKAMDEKEQGFTLVELLVVVIIIGILAAIAIPLYLNQQKNAHDSAVKGDLHNAATAVAAALVEDSTLDSVDLPDNQSESTLTITDPVPISADGTFTITATSAGTPGNFSIDETGQITEP